MSEEKEIQEKLPVAGSPLPGKENLPAKQPGPEPGRIEQPQTSNLKPQTEEMEVHHHGHVHHQKKWKEYLFQFLMLFLAVFCGFLAENQREHYIEHQRAKVYAASMVNDLISDTAELNSYLNYMTYANRNVDTLIRLVSQEEPKNIPSGKLYWYGLWGGAYRTFVSNDATFQQMKSSGSLRYFTSKSISRAAARYDQLYRKVVTYEESERQLYTEVRKLRAQIFDFRYNAVANNIYQSSPDSPDPQQIDSFIKSNPPLLTYDKTVFNQYIELVRSRFYKSKLNDADSLLQQASVLIDELKKEYRLE